MVPLTVEADTSVTLMSGAMNEVVAVIDGATTVAAATAPVATEPEVMRPDATRLVTPVMPWLFALIVCIAG